MYIWNKDISTKMQKHIETFDERHRSSHLHVTPLEEVGIRVNEKSIAAWNQYVKDYDVLKAEENTCEGEDFMISMPSFRMYLEKNNFIEKQQRRLKIGTYSGNSTLQKLKVESDSDSDSEEKAELEAPPVLMIERVKIEDESGEELEDEILDFNDAYLEKNAELESYEEEYCTSSFISALKMHTDQMNEHKKALWNDMVVFVSKEQKKTYNVHFLRSHAFPDKTHIISRLNEWKELMNTLGKQSLAHTLKIKNVLGKEFKVSAIPYRLDQAEELWTMSRKKGAYTIELVGNKSLI